MPDLAEAPADPRLQPLPAVPWDLPAETPPAVAAPPLVHGALLVRRMGDLRRLPPSVTTAQRLGAAAAELLGHPVGRVLACVVDAAAEARLQAVLAGELPAPDRAFAFAMPALAGPDEPRPADAADRTDDTDTPATATFTATARPSVALLEVCVHTPVGAAVLAFEVLGSPAPADADGFFMRVTAAVGRLQTPDSVRGFCQQLADEVRAITGLDRVLAYRFHADHHGEVIAESKRSALAPWLGLHQAAADIPQPARQVFQRLWIRSAPPPTGPNTRLGLPSPALQGASALYADYLAELDVAASLTLPLLRNGELWGLMACHHHTPTPFAPQVRAACELLSQVASLTLQSAEQTEQLAYRLRLDEVHQQLVLRSARDDDLLALTAQQPSLLDGIEAGGAALFHQQRWWCVGRVPAPAQLDALAAWLHGQAAFGAAARPVFATDTLARDCPAAVGLEDVAAGLLATPFLGQPGGWLMWFRPQSLHQRRWAVGPAAGEAFTESVQGQARPWLGVEVDAALRLRTLVMELVISRSERLAQLNATLSRSQAELDAFANVASHDLKEPLRGIQRHAQRMLVGAGPDDVQQRLHGLVQLAVRMDQVLDSLMHVARVGRMPLEVETVDLNTVVADAIELTGALRPRPGRPPCVITIPRPLPTLACDPVRVCEVYSQLLSNALKFRKPGGAHIEIGYLAATEATPRPKAPPGAAGHTILYVRDQGIGIDPQHHAQVFRLFKRLHGTDDFGGGVGAGLGIVQRLVQRHGGSVWLDAALSVGSTFFFTLPSPERHNEPFTEPLTDPFTDSMGNHLPTPQGYGS
jgi:two-component system, chemotaxis family, sensor kinase Cph1